jgi:hypothetical protein
MRHSGFRRETIRVLTELKRPVFPLAENGVFDSTKQPFADGTSVEEAVR